MHKKSDKSSPSHVGQSADDSHKSETVVTVVAVTVVAVTVVTVVVVVEVTVETNGTLQTPQKYGHTFSRNCVPPGTSGSHSPKSLYCSVHKPSWLSGIVHWTAPSFVAVVVVTVVAVTVVAVVAVAVVAVVVVTVVAVSVVRVVVVTVVSVVVVTVVSSSEASVVVVNSTLQSSHMNRQ